MTDFSKVLEQAKDMQNKMKETQESIKKIEVEGIAGGGSIKICLNGDGELIKLQISPEMMKESKLQKKQTQLEEAIKTNVYKKMLEAFSDAKLITVEENEKKND